MPLSASEITDIYGWLVPTQSQNATYYHLHLLENKANRRAILPILARYARDAHSDSVAEIRRITVGRLDTRQTSQRDQVLAAYPNACTDTTLKGYFGELMAGLVAEAFSPKGEAWHVPAFLFHTHDLLFQELIRFVHVRDHVRQVVGHSGADCLAFSTTGNTASITRVLICEAKCSSTHRSDLIVDAFESLNSGTTESAQVSLVRIIDALHRRATPVARTWIGRLEHFKDSGSMTDQSRDDLLTYVYGTRPRTAGARRIAQDAPNSAYTARRRLTATELSLDADVTALVRDVYRMAFP